MPKQKTPAAPPPLVLTITLSDDGALPRQGQILVQRGTLATMRQFSYRSLAEISLAIQQAASALIQLEQHPPDIAPEPAAVSTLPPVPESSADAVTEAADDVPTTTTGEPPAPDTPTTSAQLNLL